MIGTINSKVSAYERYYIWQLEGMKMVKEEQPV